MAVSIFDEKAFMPTDDMVAVVLADAYPLLNDLRDFVRGEYPSAVGEWKYYGKAAGWWFKFIYKKKILTTFAPNQGYYRVRVGIGETVDYLGIAELSDDIKEMISAATHYIEGRYIDIDISRPEQVEIVKILLKIKFR